MATLYAYRHPDGYPVRVYDPSTIEVGDLHAVFKGRIKAANARVAVDQLRLAQPGDLTTVYGSPFGVGTNAGKAPRSHFEAVTYV
jgi:hypothetical protein